MRLVRTNAALRKLVTTSKTSGARIAFVPTMGYLHEGHRSLMLKARKVVGPRGLVITSIFVNPTQFAPDEDLSRYPRDLARDKALCRAATVDAIYAPDEGEIYPPGFSTFVVEEQVSLGMEGAARPTHFRGVATIVAKLFNLVQPDVAVFGAKDFQQAALIQRMVRDLNFPVRIVIAPTVRETDGLALSSRNKYLSPVERSEATVLFRALRHAQQRVSERACSKAELKDEVRRFVRQQSTGKLDYVEFIDPVTLKAVDPVQRGAHMALAVFIGKTRLIDNARL